MILFQIPLINLKFTIENGENHFLVVRGDNQSKSNYQGEVIKRRSVIQ